jgi:hypothetical protein
VPATAKRPKRVTDRQRKKEKKKIRRSKR